jgi:peroxiredoxin
LRGIERNLDKLKDLGIRPVAISVDPPEVSRDLTKSEGYTFTFLSDPKAEVIKRYQLLHSGADSEGEGVARPAEYIVDPSGTIRWANFTENYWVRATPQQIIEAAKTVQ